MFSLTKNYGRARKKEITWGRMSTFLKRQRNREKRARRKEIKQLERAA